ncbi:hypothetical protein SNEBB_003694 [Seison nebaliae]|nr:hypothetical protein SNEBB_003694 [Seison nebaliae]
MNTDLPVGRVQTEEARAQRRAANLTTAPTLYEQFTFFSHQFHLSQPINHVPGLQNTDIRRLESSGIRTVGALCEIYREFVKREQRSLTRHHEMQQIERNQQEMAWLRKTGARRAELALDQMEAARSALDNSTRQPVDIPINEMKEQLAEMEATAKNAQTTYTPPLVVESEIQMQEKNEKSSLKSDEKKPTLKKKKSQKSKESPKDDNNINEPKPISLSELQKLTSINNQNNQNMTERDRIIELLRIIRQQEDSVPRPAAALQPLMPMGPNGRRTVPACGRFEVWLQSVFDVDARDALIAALSIKSCYELVLDRQDSAYQPRRRKKNNMNEEALTGFFTNSEPSAGTAMGTSRLAANRNRGHAVNAAVASLAALLAEENIDPFSSTLDKEKEPAPVKKVEMDIHIRF